MRGQEGFWSEKRVTLLSGAVLSQWSPDDDPDITVAFLRMPDGNMNGAGFPSTGHASLPKLLTGSIGSLSPIDGSPPLSSEALIAALAEVIQAYHPAQLITHVPSTAAKFAAGDHPDHGAAGTYARAAWQRAGFPGAEVRYAVGYPSASFPVNVTGDTLSRKLAAFRVYAAQDPVVTCATDAACLAKPKFGDVAAAQLPGVGRRALPGRLIPAPRSASWQGHRLRARGSRECRPLPRSVGRDRGRSRSRATDRRV